LLTNLGPAPTSSDGSSLPASEHEILLSWFYDVQAAPAGISNKLTFNKARDQLTAVLWSELAAADLRLVETGVGVVDRMPLCVDYFVAWSSLEELKSRPALEEATQLINTALLGLEGLRDHYRFSKGSTHDPSRCLDFALQLGIDEDSSVISGLVAAPRAAARIVPTPTPRPRVVVPTSTPKPRVIVPTAVPSPTAAPINLPDCAEITSGTVFRWGDSSDQLISAQGSPDSIEETGHLVTAWYYGKSWVELYNKNVVRWGDNDCVLRLAPKTAGATFSFDSSAREVTAAQGSPRGVLAGGHLETIWYYGLSRVTLYNGRVVLWDNAGSNLRLTGTVQPTTVRSTSPTIAPQATRGTATPLPTQEQPSATATSSGGKNTFPDASNPTTNNTFFTLGSSRAEVLASQGNPTSTDARGEQKWFYGESWVQFNYGDEVMGWDNSGGDLRLR
jgi:hypothetical protein